MKPITLRVTSAYKLNQKQQERILDTVKKKYDTTEVTLSETVDPSVIGGIRLVIDSTEHDHTIARQLEQLTTHLKARNA